MTGRKWNGAERVRSAEESEWDRLYRDDFRKFLWHVWLSIPEISAVPTKIQYDIAYYLQHGPQRTCIEALRGLGKSYITCAYAVWRLMNDRDEAILICSASKKKAMANGRFIRDIIYTMDICRPLRLTEATRRSRSRKVLDNALEFDVEGSSIKQVASVTCVGVEGQVTGARATVIICDDIEISTNSLTKTQRDKIETLVTEFDAVIKPGANNRLIYLGTPHNSDSLYDRLEPKGYQIRIWPAEVPDTSWLGYYGRNLGNCIRKMVDAGEKAGTPTDDRFDEWELLKRRTAQQSKYASQYMLDTRMNDANRFPLKLSNLIIMDVDRHKAPVYLAWSSMPELVWQDLDPACQRGDKCYRPFKTDPRFEKYERSIMIVDPSGVGADRTGVCIMNMLHGRLFVPELFGMDGGFERPVLERIARTAKEYGVDTILIETNQGGGHSEREKGGMFGALLKPILQKHQVSCQLEGVWNYRQKELRICDDLEPVLGSHRLVIDKGVIARDNEIEDENHRLCYQLTHITREKSSLEHDDLIDPVAMGVKYCTDMLSRDEDEAREQYEQDQYDKALEQFMSMVDENQPEDNGNMFGSNDYDMTDGGSFRTSYSGMR